MLNINTGHKSVWFRDSYTKVFQISIQGKIDLGPTGKT